MSYNRYDPDVLFPEKKIILAKPYTYFTLLYNIKKVKTFKISDTIWY